MKIDWKIVGLIIILTCVFCFAMACAFLDNWESHQVAAHNISILLRRWWILVGTFMLFMLLTRRSWWQKKE